MTELSTQQQIHNDQAEEILQKQVKFNIKQKIKLKALKNKSQDLTQNTLSLEYLVKHLNLDKFVKNLGKSNEIQDNLIDKKSVRSSKLNSMSAGEIASELKEGEKEKIMENEVNFEEMHKVNLDNSQEFKDKIDELRNN